MCIADEKGQVYEVNKPEQLINDLDNDSMLEILKYTYMTKCVLDKVHENIKSGAIKKIGGENREEEVLGRLIQGIDYMKNHLLNVLNEEIVNEAIQEIDNLINEEYE